tara:strand:+ start:3281 stop:3643 length:363 start_codon:yes stop_codon:yes gene_type:complete
MIFEVLYDAALEDELILIEGGMCRFHLRRDGQLTIHEIIILPKYQKQGKGKEILERLKRYKKSHDATSIFAKCPIDLEANGWYKHIGFELMGVISSSTGREINLWRYRLSSTVQMEILNM